MATFTEAEQARLSLKMNLSHYAWHNGSSIAYEEGDFIIILQVSKLNNDMKKIIPIVHNGVSVRVDVPFKKF